VTSPEVGEADPHRSWPLAGCRGLGDWTKGKKEKKLKKKRKKKEKKKLKA